MDKKKIEKAIKDILEAIGEDPNREGLKETPKRVAKMYEEIFYGINQNPAKELKIFFEEEHDKQFLVVCKTFPALRITAYKLIIDLIDQYGLPKRHNKSEALLKFNGNEMRFRSLDDPEKIKSFNVNY